VQEPTVERHQGVAAVGGHRQVEGVVRPQPEPRTVQEELGGEVVVVLGDGEAFQAASEVGVQRPVHPSRVSFEVANPLEPRKRARELDEREVADAQGAGLGAAHDGLDALAKPFGEVVGN
jgi:hypothetical protein